MTDVVCDASIALKWFKEEGETEVDDALALLKGHRDGQVSVWILDLTFYEIGNVLLRSLRWNCDEVADQLDDLRVMCGVLEPGAGDLRLAARLAEAHELTLYDAVYAASAQARGCWLATADAALLSTGLGERVGVIAAREVPRT